MVRVWLGVPMIHWIERCWRSAEGESYLNPKQPPVHSAECTRNCTWGLYEELPIGSKSRTNKLWHMVYTSLTTTGRISVSFDSCQSVIGCTAVGIWNITIEVLKISNSIAARYKQNHVYCVIMDNKSWYCIWPTMSGETSPIKYCICCFNYHMLCTRPKNN